MGVHRFVRQNKVGLAQEVRLSHKKTLVLQYMKTVLLLGVKNVMTITRIRMTDVIKGRYKKDINVLGLRLFVVKVVETG